MQRVCKLMAPSSLQPSAGPRCHCNTPDYCAFLMRRLVICALVLTLVPVLDLLSLWGTSTRFYTQGSSNGCQLDDEGSWSVGLFKGPSPLDLQPIELVQPRVDGSSTWPVANPILTCASVTDAPSNFVADPFLWVHPNGSWYLFFQTKTSATMQGDIGVAESVDNGTSWRYLGLALDEPCHLGYPFVFEWGGQIYMLPSGQDGPGLQLYRATQFPLRWEPEVELADRPLAGNSLVQWEGRWWMFTSEGRSRCSELEVYYANTPLGPWQPHALNPVMSGDRRAGARMAGRLVPFQGGLLRFGQDCGDTYGHRVVAYRVERLTPTEFQQSPVPLQFGQSGQGQAAWNGVRHHHLDAQQLPDGSWVAVMDGDSQPSGAICSKIKRAAAMLAATWGAVLGIAGALSLRSRRALLPVVRSSPSKPLPGGQPARVKCGAPGCLAAGRCSLRALWGRLQQRSRQWGSDATTGWAACCGSKAGGRINAAADQGSGGSSSARRLCNWSCHRATGRCGEFFPGSRAARWAKVAAFVLLVPAALLAAAAALGCWYYLSIWWDRPTAGAAVAVGGQLSKFTLLTMTYSVRMPTLRLFVQHYSRCPSVAEILVVWNRGPPPVVGRDLPAVGVPVRVRVEPANSLNNRFKPDPELRTRAVLQLDDDTLLRCADIERGFAAWRQHPESIVGFYPRLIGTQPPAYLGDAVVYREGLYNAMITKAAFLDAERAFQLYWDPRNAPEREIVDRLFNGEDILMNFVWAAATASGQQEHGEQMHGSQGQPQAAPPTVVYVHPRRRLDISGLSSVGISRSSAHAEKRRTCIAEFERLFGGSPLRMARLGPQQKPLCGMPGLGCVFL